MKYYVMSDIHGEYRALMDALDSIEFNLSKSKLIFLGDYVDRGPDSFKVLNRIKELQDEYPNNVVALLGNHDEMFLDWIDGESFNHLWNDPKGATINSFWGAAKRRGILFVSTENFPTVRLVKFAPFEVSDDDYQSEVANEIKKHKELLQWYRNLPLYYQVDDVVFVHAGLDEEEEDWKNTSRQTMIWKYPAQMGKTPWGIKVVAGHVMTKEMWKDENRHSIFRDGDHIYIDGAAPITKKLNILVYDDETGQFFDKDNNEINPS